MARCDELPRQGVHDHLLAAHLREGRFRVQQDTHGDSFSGPSTHAARRAEDSRFTRGGARPFRAAEFASAPDSWYPHTAMRCKRPTPNRPPPMDLDLSEKVILVTGGARDGNRRGGRTPARRRRRDPGGPRPRAESWRNGRRADRPGGVPGGGRAGARPARQDRRAGEQRGRQRRRRPGERRRGTVPRFTAEEPRPLLRNGPPGASAPEGFGAGRS